MILLFMLLAIQPDQIEELAAANKYDEALTANTEAEKAAVKAKDADTVLRCRERKKELTFLKAQYDKVRDADTKLAADPTDAEAADKMGRFYIFIKGDWTRGMAAMANSKDAFLKALAEKEAAAKTGPDKAAVGDAWLAGSAEIESKGLLTGATATANVKADKELVARARGKMIERALYWWQEAWVLLEDKDRERLRPKFRDAYMTKGAPPDKAGTPECGWGHINPAAKWGISQTYAHSGKRSLTITATNGTMNYMKPVRLIPGKDYELSCWGLGVGTEGRTHLSIIGSDAAGKLFQQILTIEPDIPFWKRSSVKFKAGDGTGTFTLCVVSFMNKGQVWIDDVALTCEGKDVISATFE